MPLPESVQLTPQSHEATLEDGNASPAPPPSMGYGAGIGSGSGGGVGGGKFRVGGNGSLSGIVRDPTGAVVPGAHVTISNDSGFSQTVSADSSGRYNFNGVPAGAAKLDFSSPGFKNQRTSVNVSTSYRNGRRQT